MPSELSSIDLWDCALRINWTQEDGLALNELIRAYQSEDPYNTWLHQEGNRWSWRFLRLTSEEREAMFLNQAARYLGSILDHYRATLNYLAYQIALLSIREDTGLQGQLHAEAVEFPIFNDRQAFRQKNRVKRLPEHFLSRLEAVQPYNGGHHGLWVLHELAREYRHRIIHPMALIAAGTGLGGIFEGAFPPAATDIEITYRGGHLEQGGNLCSFTTNQEFNPASYPRPVIAIGIDHPLCHGRSCMNILNSISADVIAVLNEWAEEPWTTAR
jgi:hypothetical protein